MRLSFTTSVVFQTCGSQGLILCLESRASVTREDENELLETEVARSEQDRGDILL